MAQAEWLQVREELADAVRRGCEPRLREFYDEHFPRIYRYVLCRVENNHADAEEVVAEVFFQAFRDVESYNAEQPVDAWLRGIARHRVLDFYRARRRRNVVEVAFSRFDRDFMERLMALEAAELPRDALERNELSSLVELVLTDLPDDYERVLRMKYMEEKPVQEIARVLEIGGKAAETRLFRARAAFREGFRLLAGNMEYV